MLKPIWLQVVPVRGVKPVLGLMYPPRKPCLPNPDAWWGTRRRATSCFFFVDSSMMSLWENMQSRAAGVQDFSCTLRERLRRCAAAGVGQAPEVVEVPVPGPVSAAAVCCAVGITAPGVPLGPEVSERRCVYGTLGRAQTPVLLAGGIPGPRFASLLKWF